MTISMSFCGFQHDDVYSFVYDFLLYTFWHYKIIIYFIFPFLLLRILFILIFLSCLFLPLLYRVKFIMIIAPGASPSYSLAILPLFDICISFLALENCLYIVIYFVPTRSLQAFKTLELMKLKNTKIIITKNLYII